MAETSLSIVVPIWNTRPHLLHLCVESVVRQASADCELILVDDGSALWCRSSAEALARRARTELASVHYLGNGVHRGMAAARNAGVRAAGGSHVLLLDSDDELAAGAIETLESNLRRASPILAFADHVQTSEDGTEIVAVREKRPYFELWKEFRRTAHDPMLHATFLFHPQVFRRDAYWSVGGLDETMGFGDEVELHLRLLDGAGSDEFLHIDDRLYRYRTNPESVVHNPVSYQRLIANIEQLLLNWFQKFDATAVACRRIGRSTNTSAAHYGYFTANGSAIPAPYFDYDAMEMLAA